VSLLQPGGPGGLGRISRSLGEERVGCDDFVHDVSGPGFWAEDATIEVWLYLLVDATAELGGPEWVTAARESWAVQAGTGFHGCVDVGLDEHLGGDPRREPHSWGCSAVWRTV
jgi:hypothetical protein